MLWRLRRTNIYLDETQTASLDRLAVQQGVSLREVEPPDRGPGDREEHLGRMWRRKS